MRKIYLLLIACLSSLTGFGQTYQSFSASGNAWNTNHWSSSSATNACVSTSLTNAFSSGSIVYLCTASGTGSGSLAVQIGGIICTQNYTHTGATGTLSTGGTVVTVDVASGTTLVLGPGSTSGGIATTAGTGFIKSNSGTWDITGESGAYPGGFTLNAGTVIVDKNNVFGNGAMSINGGTIQSSGGRTFAVSSLTIGGDFVLSGTSQDVWGMSVGLGSATRTITNSTSSGSATRTFSGVISGSSNVGMNFAGAGSGTINISGTSNTYTGNLAFNGAETVFSGDGSFGAVPGSVTANNITIDGGRLTFAASYTLNSNRGIQVGATAGTSISVGTGFTTTYNGIIADKSGSAGIIVKQGSGTLLLGGVSTYSGSTSVNNGTLQLSIGSNRLPTGTTLNIGQAASANLGTFDLNGQNQTVAGINSTAGTNATASNNTITSSTAATLTLGGNSTYSYGDGTNANSGVISGSLSLVINGGGTQTLGDANTYTGSTTISNSSALSIISGASGNGLGNDPGSATTNLIINAGTLTSTASSDWTLSQNRIVAIGPGSGYGNATINLTNTGNVTIAGQITDNGGHGTLVKSGTERLTLTSGSSNWSGGITINAGELRFNPSSNLNLAGATNTVTLNGGTLGFNSITAGTSVTFGTLTLTDNSTIDLSASNAQTLHFSASNGVSWTAGKIITITGWQGNYTGGSGTTGQIFAGSDATGLSVGQIAQIQFKDGSNNLYQSTILSTGEICPLSPLPSISNSGNVSGITYNYGSGPSTSTTFTISGSYLTGYPANITVTSSADYEVSADNLTFGSTALIPYTSATLGSTTVYVRLIAGKVIGSYNSETITISGGGAASNSTLTASGSVTAPAAGYFSASSGALDATASWGTDAGGTVNHPQNFTDAGQVFHIANNNSGTISGATWTISGSGSQLNIDQSGNDLTVLTGHVISGNVYVGANRTLTMQTTTYPTFTTPDPASTIKFSGLSTITSIPTSPTYGNIVIDNTTYTPSTGQTVLFAGDFTLSNGASVNSLSSSAGLNLNTSGNGAQTLHSNNLTFVLNQLNSTKSAGSLTLASSSTSYTSINTITTVYTGSSSFFDGGNTIIAGNNLYMDGDGASNYTLTGTVIMNGNSGTSKIASNSGNLSPIVPHLNNLTFSLTSTGGSTFFPAAGGSTITVNGNLNFSSSYTSSGTVVIDGNTLNLSGNFISSPASSVLATGSSSGTLAFVGSSAQSYTSTSSNTIKNVTINNVAGVTLNNNLTCSSTGTLTLTNGTLAINGPSTTLTVNNTITQTSGHIDASNGTIKFNSATATQTVPANTFTGTVKNLIINNSAASSPGVILSSATTIGSTGTVTISAGTFTTGGFLTLASDASGDARIDQITGTGALSSDNVTIQKYIPGQRAYRAISNPFTTTMHLSAITPYVDISGSGGVSNGFSVNAGNNPSAYYFVPSYDGTGTNSAWQPFTSANGGGNNNWNPLQAILLFVRGAVGQGLNTNYYGTPPSNVTVSMSGPVNTGSNSLTATAYRNDLVGGYGDGWNIIGNPLPSQIDLNSIGNIGSVASDIFLIDPKGNFNNDSTNGTAYFHVNLADSSVTIPMCGAFMVHNTSSTTDVALQFPEACKISSTPPKVFFRSTGGNMSYLAFLVYKDSFVWDEMELRFISGARNNASDVKDVKKFSNMTTSFYTITPDSMQLLADARDPDSLYPGYTIPMGISSILSYTFNLKVAHYDQQAGLAIYLHDNYTNTTTLLDNSIVYPVTISSDPASQGNNRLQLVFGSTTGINSLAKQGKNPIKIYPNPANEEINVSFNSDLAANTNIEIINTLGQTVQTINSDRSIRNINIPVGKLSPGIYIVKTISGNTIISERFIKN